MTTVNERFMSGSQQKGNQAKFGFIETNLEIVEMELNLIDFSDLEGLEINICDLSGGEGNQINFTKEYLEKNNLKPKAYYNEIHEERYNLCKSKFEDLNCLNSDFFNLKVGRKESNKFKKDLITLVRNNPPYMYIERNNRTVRAEVEFIAKNTDFNAAGGIQIIEIPKHQLEEIPSLLKFLCKMYEIYIYKFPEEIYKKYSQIAIIGKKKEKPFLDENIYNEIKFNLENDLIPYLSNENKKIFKIRREDVENVGNIEIFRDKTITDETLFNGLNDVISELINVDKKNTIRNYNTEKLIPLIEPLAGHISQLLAAGRFDGINGNFLIRGGARKMVECKTDIEHTEKGTKKTETQTEVLKPFLEITNSRGEILRKDF